MKFISSVLALALCAGTLSAQQRPLPPTPPTPPAATLPVGPPIAPMPMPMPLPMPMPRVYQLPSTNWELSGQLGFDADRLRSDAERMAREMTERSWDMSRAAQRVGERATEQAQESANRALERLSAMDWRASLEPLARVSTNIATTFGNDLALSLGSLYFNSGFAPISQSQWEWSQGADPADSLYNVARDAMNRGEYRRSADLFAQVQSKYPKSTRVSAAAYYEAYMRYKLGTTEELRSALRLLTEKSITTSSSSSVNQEISVLTTRVRGALAARGDAEQARIVAQEAKKGGCDREDMQVRAEALSGLAQSDMNAATPLLRRVLDKKDPCALDLRRRALSILLRRADTAATSAAISVARNTDETLELRVDAVSYLSRLPGDNALATLEDLLRTSTDREVQRAAVRSLANSDNTRARAAVRSIVERNDVSEALRMEALNSFSSDRSSSDDGAYLRSLFGKMQSERLKAAVLSSISRVGGPENDQFLLSVARNSAESGAVRASAINRLSRGSTTVSVADLTKLYDAAESRSLRNQVVSALSQRKEPEALDKLIDILKTSTDSSVRSQVVNILARSADPKARQALTDVSGRP